jgi:hypothetical protein
MRFTKYLGAAAAIALSLGLASHSDTALGQHPPALPVLQRALVGQVSLTLTGQGAGEIDTADQNNFADRVVACAFDQASHTGSPSTTVTIEGRDPVSGVYFPLLTSSALTDDGVTYLSAGPGLSPVAGISAPVAIPAVWRAQVLATAGTITGSLTCWRIN